MSFVGSLKKKRVPLIGIPDTENPDVGFSPRPSITPENPDIGFQRRPSLIPTDTPALSGPPDAAIPPPVSRPRLVGQPAVPDTVMNAGVPAQPTQPEALPPPPAEMLSDPTATRPRLSQPVDPIVKARENLQDSQTRPLYSNVEGDVHKPSRWKGALAMALRGLGPSMAQAQANSANHRGGFGAGDFFAGLAGAAGAGIGGAIDPTQALKLQRQDETAQRQGTLNQAIENAKSQAELDNMQAQAAERKAKPGQLADAAKEEARTKAENRLISIWKGTQNYNPDDPADTASQAIKAQAEALGLALPPKKGKEASASVITKDVGGKHFQYDHEKKQWIPANGLPDEQMVTEDGLQVTPGQALSYRGQVRRESSTAAREDARAVNEDTRYSADKFDSRMKEASTLRQKLEDAKSEAVALKQTHDSLSGSVRKEDKARASAAQEKANVALEKAKGYAQQIKDEYGDIYEAGNGEGGFPYAKPRNAQRPTVAPRSARPSLSQKGAYSGVSIPRANLSNPALLKRLGVSSPAEAERIITSNGGSIE